MNSNYFLMNGNFSTYIMTLGNYYFYSTSLSLVTNKINNLVPSVMKDIINNKKFITLSSLVATLTIPQLYPPILLINFIGFFVLNLFIRDDKPNTIKTDQETKPEGIIYEYVKKRMQEAKFPEEKIEEVTQHVLNKFYTNLNAPETQLTMHKKEPNVTIIRDVPFLTQCINKDESVLKIYPDILEKIHTILNQKELNHIVLCGKPGCGKSSLIKVLANELIEEEIPYLKGHELYKLNAAELASSTSYSGQLQTKLSKLQKFIESKKTQKIKLIIFIDEVHLLSGMGTTQSNSNDVWQFLKEGMADSSFTILGTTTENEYNKTIAKDKALQSRLTKLSLSPLSPKQEKEMLHFKAKKLIEETDTLKSLSQEEKDQTATKLIEESIKIESSNSFNEENKLRDISKQLVYQFSIEDLKRQGFLSNST